MSDSFGTTPEDGERNEQTQEESATGHEHAGESDRGKFAQALRAPLKTINIAATGVVAARDSFVNLLTANDSGAQRVAAAAERASAHIGDDLGRGDLTPDERMQRHDAEERILNAVKDNEKGLRKANEQAFTFVTLAVLGLAGAVVTVTAVRSSKS